MNHSTEQSTGCVISDDGRRLIRAPNVRTVSIPEGITEIGGFAFYDRDNLTSIEIPDGVKVIGGFAFSGCTSLKSVSIPKSVREIQIGAFRGCRSIYSIHIPDSVERIGPYAFMGVTAGLPRKWDTDTVRGRMEEQVNIYERAQHDITELADIIRPWAEGKRERVRKGDPEYPKSYNSRDGRIPDRVYAVPRPSYSPHKAGIRAVELMKRINPYYTAMMEQEYASSPSVGMGFPDWVILQQSRICDDIARGILAVAPSFQNADIYRFYIRIHGIPVSC